ncbi:MAG: MarR family winged helix-turn-helix transcriptional regulator [Luteimonas sp.]
MADRPTKHPAETAPVTSSEASAPDATARGVKHAVLELERFLPYRLSVLSNRVSQTIADQYAVRFGLAITEWRVMAALGRYPELSANQVATRTAMDKVAVSRAVAKLLERGLLQREMHDNDRRRSVLALSPAGYGVYDEVVPMALDCERRLLEHFSDDERATLDKLIDRLMGLGLSRLRDGEGAAQ